MSVAAKKKWSVHVYETAKVYVMDIDAITEAEARSVAFDRVSSGKETWTPPAITRVSFCFPEDGSTTGPFLG